MTDHASRIVFALPGNEALAASLASSLDSELGSVTVRHFPDGETYVRIESPVRGRDVILTCTLDRPDDKILPLLFLGATARELGAERVGLVAPYLAYMRQDRRFNEGEGVSSLPRRKKSWPSASPPFLARPPPSPPARSVTSPSVRSRSSSPAPRPRRASTP